MKKKLIWLVVVIGIFSFYLFWKEHSDRRSLEKLSLNTTSTTSVSGAHTLPLTTNEWQGAIVDGKHRIDAKLLTRDTFWQVRLDGDNDRIFTLHPVNWVEKSHLEITNRFNLMEWRILPGQKTTQGMLVYAIRPKDESPAF